MNRLPHLSSPAAVAATVTLFGYNGLAIGVWAASIPALRERHHLDGLGISTLLVTAGVAAIIGMQVGGRLSDRLGARLITLVALPILMAGVAAIGFAPTVPLLLAAAVVLGFGNGFIDVSMNALGVHVEKNRPRPIMSFFHGLWSVGNFAGAVLVLALATAVGTGPAMLAPAASLAAGLGIVALGLAYRLTPDTPREDHVDEHGTKTRVPRSAYLLGLMAIAFGLGEGTAMDWSGVLVADVTGIDSGQAAVAVAAVALFMVVIRLLGDRLVERFGRRAIVRFGGTCAALGYLLVAFWTPLPALLVGWSLVGLGIGMIAPQVYAVAGHAGGGRGLAVVVTFGYATFLAGPAVIGLLVNALGIQRAMIVPGVLLLGLIVLARIMPSRVAERRAPAPPLA